MKNLEIKIKELKKEFTEQEAENLTANLLKNLDNIFISQGATPIEKAKAKRAGTVEAADNLSKYGVNLPNLTHRELDS